MKTKPIPIIIALLAASISCIISLVNKVSLNIFLINFAVTAVVFLLIGYIVMIAMNIGLDIEKKELERIKKEEEEKAAAEAAEAAEAEDENGPEEF